MNPLEKPLRVFSSTIAILVSCAISCCAVSLVESPDTAITHVEASIRARFEHIAKYVVIEHYGSIEMARPKQPPNRRSRPHIKRARASPIPPSQRLVHQCG